MSEPEKNAPRGPNQNPNPDRFQPKPFIIWFILVALVLFLVLYPAEQQGNVTQLSVRQVIEKAEDGQVASLRLKEDRSGGTEWYQISGKMENPAFTGERPAPDSQAASTQADEGKEPPYLSFMADGRLTPERFAQLEQAVPADQFREIRTSTFWKDVLLGLLPFFLIIGLLYFLFVRQLRMAGKGAMSFGKSKAKMLTRDKERALFKDVAGCDEAKEEVTEIVEFLKNPKKFQQIGGRVPKGVLMVGSPGTGKTLLAKAIAGEADVPFFSISGSDFVEMFVGVGAARVRDMFEQGRRHAPCLIFIDEIDAVGRQRGAGLGGGNDEREQTLNSLLVEMDGFDTQEGIIIIAATNRPDVLDQALLRPGRFDRQVTIDMPDLEGREQILRVHAKKIKMAPDVDLQRVARSTVGCSGADLANLLNESALLAARYGKHEVSMAEIEEARDKLTFGRERRRLMDPEEKRATAFHEAGHALVRALLKDKKYQLHKVTIIPRGSALGLTMASPIKDIYGKNKAELQNDICFAMAGRIAEEVETHDISSGAYGDIRQATRIARTMVCDLGMSSLGPVALGENRDQIFLAREITRQQDYSEETARRIDEEIRRLIDEQYQRAQQLLKEHEEALTKVAEALLKYETIDGVHVQEIIEHGEIRSPVLNTTNTGKSDEDLRKEEESPNQEEGQTDDEDLGPEGAAPAGAPA